MRREFAVQTRLWSQLFDLRQSPEHFISERNATAVRLDQSLKRQPADPKTKRDRPAAVEGAPVPPNSCCANRALDVHLKAKAAHTTRASLTHLRFVSTIRNAACLRLVTSDGGWLQEAPRQPWVSDLCRSAAAQVAQKVARAQAARECCGQDRSAWIWAAETRARATSAAS